jgi:hypothetical protein
MTETKWLAGRTSRTMLDFLRGRLSERKLRLIGCACARPLTSRLKLVECLTALDLVENMAGGSAGAAEVAECARLAAELERFWRDAQARIPSRYRNFTAKCVAGAVYKLAVEPDRDLPDGSERVHENVAEALEELCATWTSASKERLRQAAVVREIVGNPFRPVAFVPAWRTSDVTNIARRVYASRDFSAMPILADALQDAGCDSTDILDHCRGPGTHVRGCWVVDLVLGRE